MKPDKSPTVDPDVWTVLSLTIATVTMFAQLAALRVSDKPKGLQFHSTNIAYDKVRDEIESAIKNCEKLVRLLRNATGLPSAPLGASFRFGASQALFTTSDFQKFVEITQNIALNAGNLSSWTLNLIRNDPGFAQLIGHKILEDVNDIHQRINRLYRDQINNEDVLDECLFLLRIFHTLLGRLDQCN